MWQESDSAGSGGIWGSSMTSNVPEGVEPPAMAEMHAMPGHLIRRMHQASLAIFDGEMGAHGFDITPVQFAALVVIAERPGLDQATLATAISFDRATTGGVIDRMEAKALVRREIDKADRRARRLFIEPAGQALLANVKPHVRSVQGKMLQGLSDQEQALLLGLLGKALEAVADVSRQSVRDGG
jgi:MarR family transcriptional regulator, temperature-dependent positive regulator of motility